MADSVASSSMERQHALLASQATKGLAETEELAEAALKEVMALMEEETHAGAQAPYCPIVYGSIAFKLKPVARKADEAPPVITPATHRWTREEHAAGVELWGSPHSRPAPRLRVICGAFSESDPSAWSHVFVHACVRACCPCASRPSAVFVRGVDGADISHAIKSVDFRLHETFPEPLRGETGTRLAQACELSRSVALATVRVCALSLFPRARTAACSFAR